MYGKRTLREVGKKWEISEPLVRSRLLYGKENTSEGV